MNHDVHIYTDGAAKGNPGRGGYGVVMELVGTPHKKEFYEGFRHTTNNRMELLAVIVGLEKLKNPNMKVLIVSDSKYVVDSVLKKWVFGWEKKGFAGKKNPDLWKRFLVVYRKHQVDFKWIKGHADAMVTGGSEAAVTIAGMGGFNAMHALSTRNDDPKTASRPMDKDRDGFVLGEGAGALILEEYEHAVARGAKIYCEIGGGGMSADAYHITAPHPEGLGAKNVMLNCLRDAGLSPTDVDGVNMHGTSTPLGDIAESKAILHVFGEHAYTMNLNSTKSMTGHLLGAAGVIETISSILSIKYGIVPPTINHFTDDENIDPKLNFTFNVAQKRDVKVLMSNTFGFGGHNACVLVKKLDI